MLKNACNIWNYSITKMKLQYQLTDNVLEWMCVQLCVSCLCREFWEIAWNICVMTILQRTMSTRDWSGDWHRWPMLPVDFLLWFTVCWHCFRCAFSVFNKVLASIVCNLMSIASYLMLGLIIQHAWELHYLSSNSSTLCWFQWEACMQYIIY